MKPTAELVRREMDVADELNQQKDALRPKVDDIVQHGTGRGSRMELTILSAGRSVRLTGLPAKRALSYRHVCGLAMEQGLVMPWLHPANEVWRQILASAMEHARLEPSLEGEEIAEAVAAEIRELLGRSHRGRDACDLMAGMAVEQRRRLLVSPRTLVAAVRKRLVDDVLLQSTIADVASTHLGMRESRPRFAGSESRPCAWAFPMPLPAARPGDGAGASLRSVDGRTGPQAAAPTGGQMRDGSDGHETQTVAGGSVHGPNGNRPISNEESRLRAGSTGSHELSMASHIPSADERPISGSKA